MTTVELRGLYATHHGPIRRALATLSLAFLMSGNPAFAQIYKWVDDAGNVHFGDKPQNKNTLDSSEKVELKSNYVPGDGPSAEQIEAGKAFLRKKDMERERQQLAAEKEAAGRQALQAQCRSMRERLTDFTEAGMRDGKRKRVDYFVEDGKTVSAKRQKEIIAELQSTISKKCALLFEQIFFIHTQQNSSPRKKTLRCRNSKYTLTRVKAVTPAINILKQRKVSHSIHQYSHDASAQSYGLEAAEKMQLPPERVFKTLVVSLDGRELAVAVIPVSSMLNMKALAQVSGAKKATMADKLAVQRATGYILGGVSPLGQKKSLKTIIDSSANNFPTLYVSAGRRGLEVELSPIDLANLTGALVEDICE